MIRVYRLPEKLTDGFCFSGGNPIKLLNVDWFEGNAPWGSPTRDEVEAEVRRKRYFDPAASFLVLADDPEHTFVIRPPAQPLLKEGE